MTIVHKTYQLRGYCTASGYNRIRTMLADCCQLYNAALQERRDFWTWKQAGNRDKEPARITRIDQMKQFTAIRSDLPEWAAQDVNIGRGVLLRVDRAFQAFFRQAKAGERPGYPRFKPRQRYTTIELAETRPGMVRVTPAGNMVIKVKGLPAIRVKPGCPLPMLGLKGLRLTLKHGSLTVSLSYAMPALPLPGSDEAVGIDMGVNQRLTLSNGEVISGHQVDRKREKRLQRQVSRAHKGSRERRQKVRMLARERERLAVQNRNRCHELTTAIVRRYRHIAVEALAIPNMVRSASGTVEEPGAKVAAKSGLNRSITKQTWGMIRQQLRYKAEWAGRVYVEVDPRNTSRTCHQCGMLAGEQPEYRIFRCPACGLEADRDVNAAINILKRSVGIPLRAHNPDGCAQENSWSSRPLAGYSSI